MDEVKRLMVSSDKNLIAASERALAGKMKPEDVRFHRQRIKRCEARIKRATS